jgi:deoxycytidylate deaminase
MNTKQHPTEIALALLNRSVCAVQVAAVLEDDYGVYAWGWNSSGPDGYGMHAEAHCLSRANLARVKDSTLYVAARRRRSSRPVTAKPCLNCAELIKNVERVVFRDGNGVWIG